MRRALPLLLLCLTNCTQRMLFVGTIQPASGTCDPAAQATLTLRGHAVEFAPTAGVLILSGELATNGQLTASFSRQGADKTPYQLQLRATLTNRQIDGDYISQRCRYSVHLSRD